MTEEDEEFNRIEREAAMRKEAVRATASQHNPMHPEIKKMYEDYFDKCFRESSKAQHTWVFLTDKERNDLWREIMGWGDPSHDDEDLMKAIEDASRRKNEM